MLKKYQKKLDISQEWDKSGCYFFDVESAPEDVQFDINDLQVKVGDFGISRLFTEEEEERT
jgi:hypothetical protein